MPLFVLKLAFASAAATQPVHRCIGAHGEPVFSGQACANGSEAVGPAANAYPDWGGTCAMSAEDLRNQVAAAFDTHDVNLLAGLFLWTGYGNRPAHARLRDLSALVKSPLAGLQLESSDSGLPAAGNPEESRRDSAVDLVIYTGNKDVAYAPLHEDRFAVVQRDACVWLAL